MEAKKQKTSEASPKIKPAKIPALAEMAKNPMKYIAEASMRFEKLSQQVENQGKAIVEIAKHVESSDKKLAPLVNAIEQAQAAQTQAAPTAGGSGLPVQGGGQGMQLISMLAQAMSGGGGGGMDEEMMNLTKDMMRTSIQRIKTDILDSDARRQSDLGFAKAVQNAIVQNIAGKAAKNIIESGS